jgi:hypothetical protein
MKEIRKRLNGKDFRKWTAAHHRQLNKEMAQTIQHTRRWIVCAFTITYYKIIIFLFTYMWIYVAATSQKSNAESVQKNITYHLQFFDAQNTVKTVQ